MSKYEDILSKQEIKNCIKISENNSLVKSINTTGLAIISQELNISLIEAMVFCLKKDLWPLRFIRNYQSFSAHDQIKFLESKVVIIGCGGLGGHCANLLTRAGIGEISLVDGDMFSESNLNRQLFCTEAHLNKNKALVIAQEIRQIASHIKIKAFPSYLNPANADEILKDHHLILDCLDSIPARLMLEELAEKTNIPFIHTSIAGTEAFISIIFPKQRGLKKLYGSEERSGEKQAEKILGVPTITPAGAAALQSAKTLNFIIDKKLTPLELHHLDFMNFSINNFMF